MPGDAIDDIEVLSQGMEASEAWAAAQKDAESGAADADAAAAEVDAATGDASAAARCRESRQEPPTHRAGRGGAALL